MNFGDARNRIDSGEPCPSCGNRTVVRVLQKSAPDGWFQEQEVVVAGNRRRTGWLIALVLLVIALSAVHLWIALTPPYPHHQHKELQDG